MFKLKYVILLVFPLLLIGCQVEQQKDHLPVTQQWQIHQQDLKQITAFQVNGSLAYFSDSSRNYGRFLIIQQAPNNYEIKLTSPVGTNLLTLSVQPDYAELVDKEGKRYADQNVENLMLKLSNINIPLNSLHNWLKGLSDNESSDKLDKSGRLASTEFMQNNNKWNLKISNYMTRNYKNKNIDLPATLELTHEDERVRLKIDNWILR